MEKSKKSKSQQRIEELETQLKRLAADFDNYKKRADTERKEVFALAQAQALLEIAPVLDNFRRATDHLPEDLKQNNWVTGVLYVERQLEQILNDAGITKIKTIGELFNPALHEAISTEPNDSAPADHVTAEIEGGYLMNGRVLKPAKVKVSSGPAEASSIE